jgi:hypothetical protein
VTALAEQWRHSADNAALRISSARAQNASMTLLCFGTLALTKTALDACNETEFAHSLPRSNRRLSGLDTGGHTRGWDCRHEASILRFHEGYVSRTERHVTSPSTF